MITKYTTGQNVLIPATIRSAREENGKVIYEIDHDYWNGIPEDSIVINNQVSAEVAFNRAMESLARDIY